MLESIVKKHLGIEGIITRLSSNIGQIQKIVLLGDYARGIDSGLIIGKNKDYLD